MTNKGRATALASLLIVGALALPATADPAVPERAHITDPAGDANVASVIDPIQNTSTPADLSEAADILKVWFTHDAATLSVHIQTEGRPGGTEGLWTYVYADPNSQYASGCLFFAALLKGSTYTWNNQAYLYDNCKKPATPAAQGDLKVSELSDGSAITTMTFLRPFSALLGSGGVLEQPRAAIAHMAGGRLPWPAPSQSRSGPTLDDTVIGSDYALGPLGVGDLPLVGSLEPGQSIFWYGSSWKSIGRSWFYALRVGRDGERLRLAIDSPVTTRSFALASGQAISPSGAVTPFSLFDEAVIADPEPGTWFVSARPYYGEVGVFRLRAKLESKRDLRPPPGHVALKPNLRSLPPYDFTFEDPITYEGDHAVSCNIDEAVEDQARRCLRFSVGPENTGDGPFELNFSPLADSISGKAIAFQRVHYSDAKTKLREAGTYEFHKTHQHYHYAGFASLELFKVEGGDGDLEPAGTGQKIGFCTVDVIMAEWHRFTQDEVDTAKSDCSSTNGAWIGLSRGWTDIYDWSLPGNYIDFGSNEDGTYLVRSHFDRKGLVVETNERDNVSYALVRVEGNDVTLLERGYGRDPWDPNKSVVEDWWSALIRS